MDKLTQMMLGVFVGMFIGMITQCFYDLRHAQIRTIYRTAIDTVIVKDTVYGEVTVNQYKPKPTKVYITKDTTSKTLSEAFITHKVYDNTFDTTKTLRDTLKYRQSIRYHITTRNSDIDTIRIMTKESIPIITHYVERQNTEYVKQKPKFTVSIGGGVGITPTGTIQPNLGIFCGYPIFSW